MHFDKYDDELARICQRLDELDKKILVLTEFISSLQDSVDHLYYRDDSEQ